MSGLIHSPRRRGGVGNSLSNSSKKGLSLSSPVPSVRSSSVPPPPSLPPAPQNPNPPTHAHNTPSSSSDSPRPSCSPPLANTTTMEIRCTIVECLSLPVSRRRRSGDGNPFVLFHCVPSSHYVGVGSSRGGGVGGVGRRSLLRDLVDVGGKAYTTKVRFNTRCPRFDQRFVVGGVGRGGCSTDL